MISVLQATAWYPPAHMGGTEAYLTGLVRGLRDHGVSSRIVAPLGPQQADGYELDRSTVRTYEVNVAPSRAELRGEVPHQGFGRFREILAEEQPQIYHQHSWSRGLGAAHLRAAHELGLRTVLTVHVPNNICLRGTMVRLGESACDGHIEEIKCAECWSHGRGAPKPLARALARIPPSLSAFLRRGEVDGRAITALCARHLVRNRQAEFAAMVANADRIVAVCQWLYDALRRNGVPEKKLILSRQGIDDSFAFSAEGSRGREGANGLSFRIVYIGRWHPVKGVHILIEAIKRVPRSVPLELVLHGIGEGVEEKAYEGKIKRLAKDDIRIRFAPAVPRERLAEIYLGADAVAVPSTCMETGPLVVLEAKAAGTPVIGSRLGGIAELIHEPDEGILVESGNVAAWTEAMMIMSGSRMMYRQRNSTRSTRTMHDVAGEMAVLYGSLCKTNLMWPEQRRCASPSQ